MGKRRFDAGNGDFNNLEEVTTMTLPVAIKQNCKKLGIKYKSCFLRGYQELTGNKAKQTQAELEELREGNKRLQRTLTRLATKLHRLEQSANQTQLGEPQ